MIDFILESEAMEEEVINLRRDFHSNPELGYMEYRTSRKIKEYLKALEIPYEISSHTGVKAVICGEGQGSVALRADMDALPIEEKNDISYKSLNKGVMHACGHDAHIAILLGAAKLLNKYKNQLKGKVVLIFEPAEETVGGARLMIEEGILNNPKVQGIFGLHVNEKIDSGCIALKEGTVNAASNPFTIIIKGKGTHGAHPEDGVDPIIIGSSIIMEMQTLVSREISPFNPAVISIGYFHGGTAENIIPEEVTIKGIIRTMRSEDREYLKKRIKEITLGVAAAMRGNASIYIEDSYPCLYNNESMERLFLDGANKILCPSNIVILKEPSMGVESFSYFAMERKSLFYYLGCKSKKENEIRLAHSSNFNISEDCLKIGVAMQAMLAWKFLNEFNDF